MCFWTIQSFLGLIKKNSYFVTHFEFWRYASSHWSWNILNIPRTHVWCDQSSTKDTSFKVFSLIDFTKIAAWDWSRKTFHNFIPKQKHRNHNRKKHINKNIQSIVLNRRIRTPNQQPQKPRRIFSVKFSASSSKNPSSLRFRWVFGETKRTGRWPWGFPTLFTGGCDVLAGWTFMKFHFYT